MTPEDLQAIGPLIAAVGTAIAVLIVDLIVPGRRGPALFVALPGAADPEVDPASVTRGEVRGRPVDAAGLRVTVAVEVRSTSRERPHRRDGSLGLPAR
jgi:hypothetical protein